MRLILILGSMLLAFNVFAQFNKDAEDLKKMSYMEFAKDINCENTTGSSIETRICLNLEFQEIDSTLNVQFFHLLEKTTDKPIKRRLIKYQKVWIKHRRLQSRIASEGYQGHMLGIRYLATMIIITQNRLEEIGNLIE